MDPEEHVILEVRKHWFVFAAHAAGLLFAGLFPFLVLAMLRMWLPGVLDFSVPGNGAALSLFVYTIWILILWILFFIEWTKYYLDVWYVTEKRIIAVDQRRIFSREVSNLRFDKIQDITIEVHGFLQTMLKFGNIQVQTASENSTDFYLASVRHPEHVRKVIFSQQNKIGDTHHPHTHV